LFDRRTETALQSGVTLQPLTRALALVAEKAEVQHAVEQHLPRCLPCAGARLSLAPDTGADSHVVHHARELRVDVRFCGARLARLEAWRSPAETPFVAADLEVLRIAAPSVATSLALACKCEELDRRAQEHAEAWRAERFAVLDTVAAEIAHEIRYPINFFRSVFQRRVAGATLDAEEVEIGCEEVDRLERLVSGLRRLPRARLKRRWVRIGELAGRAEMLLRDRFCRGRLRFSGAGNDVVSCDCDQVTQVLVNLLSNALDAAGADGEVGISWTSQGGGRLTVWDSGPGFRDGPSKLFVPWCTTKPNGTGLGLTISHRIVKAHGWSIDAERRDGRTVFEVQIPACDITSAVEAQGRGGET